MSSDISLFLSYCPDRADEGKVRRACRARQSPAAHLQPGRGPKCDWVRGPRQDRPAGHAAGVTPALPTPRIVSAEPAWSRTQPQRRRLRPIGRTELGVDPIHVVLDRLLAQHELLGDLAVRQSLGN